MYFTTVLKTCTYHANVWTIGAFNGFNQKETCYLIHLSSLVRLRLFLPTLKVWIWAHRNAIARSRDFSRIGDSLRGGRPLRVLANLQQVLNHEGSKTRSSTKGYRSKQSLKPFVKLRVLVTLWQTPRLLVNLKPVFKPTPKRIRHPAERHQYMKVHEESFTRARLKSRGQYYFVFP
jgi:hypothetical protein